MQNVEVRWFVKRKHPNGEGKDIRLDTIDAHLLKTMEIESVLKKV